MTFSSRPDDIWETRPKTGRGGQDLESYHRGHIIADTPAKPCPGDNMKIKRTIENKRDRTNTLIAVKFRSVFVLVLFLGLFASCASTAPRKPAPEAIPVSMEKEVPKKEPDVQKAYSQFTLASIAISQRDLKEARKHLSSAIENDPAS